MFIKVKVIQGQGYLGSRPLQVKVIRIQGESRSSEGHSHFEVNFILELNGNVFRFLSQRGHLAFVQMLIVTCYYQFSSRSRIFPELGAMTRETCGPKWRPSFLTSFNRGRGPGRPPLPRIRYFYTVDN